MARYMLPGPKAAPDAGLGERLRTFLIRRWPGRILLGALALFVVQNAGLPLPDALGFLVRAVLWSFGIFYGVRLFRHVLRRLLWRIRSKLLLSYLFIAVVPVVLLGSFFLIAGALFAGLVASHMLTTEITRTAGALRDAAEVALAALPADEAGSAAALAERLGPARKIHPRVSWALLRRGKVVASSADAPHSLPAWWKGPGFAGLVKAGKSEVVRAVWTRGDAVLVLDAPLDGALLADFQKRTGIRLVPVGGHAWTTERGGVKVEIHGEQERSRDATEEEDLDQAPGIGFLAAPDRTDWETGKQEPEPLLFKFQPHQFIRRLSPGSLNTADVLVKVLAIVGVIFLVMYAVALLIGLLLARSITRSVHALSEGTERLRQGDFHHPIRVRSRDQLGELADSFNMMARGIQDLLREQAEKERLEEELRIARQIQMSLLPPEGSVGLPGLRIAALCLPAAEVGGDYYDLLPLSPTRMGVLVADVSGKGTSAALYMAELKGLVLSLSRIYESPAKLLAEANRILTANMDPRSFITMTYAVVDTSARTMRYARAGHNPIIQLEAGTGLTRVLTPAGLGLGIDPGDRFEEILEEAEVPLSSGDVFLFFTDGLSEAMNGRAELFGERRLRDLIEKSQAQGGDEGAIRDQILSEIRAFVGDAAQHDDMTLVLLKVV